MGVCNPCICNPSIDIQMPRIASRVDDPVLTTWFSRTRSRHCMGVCNPVCNPRSRHCMGVCNPLYGCLQSRQIARRVTELGTPVSRHVVSQLLRKHGYRRRKALKKKTMGPRNPNRNAQFENIARLKKEYLEAGLPVVSMDTKKKELLGNFYRDGKIDTQETIKTNDHDFGARERAW